MRKIGKAGLLTSALAIGIFAASGAQASTPKTDKKTDTTPVSGAAPIAMVNPPMQMAQNVPASSNNSALEARVQALEDALAARDDRIAADHTRLSTLEQNYNYASWTFDNGRPVISSGDGRFSMGIRMRFQSDFAGFSQDKTHPAGFAGPTDLSSGAVIRRAYFGIEGKAFSDFAYEFRLNLGGTNGGSNGSSGGVTAGEGDNILNKAVISYVGIPDWHFNIGVLEPAFMFEGTTSSASLMFMERPEIDNIAADTFGAGDSRRGIEIGWGRTDVLWAGDNLTATVTYSGDKTGVAANHGPVTNGQGSDEKSQLLGRFTERLWSNGISNIQVGTSLAHVFDSGSLNNPQGGGQTINLQDRPEVRVDGTRLISTGGVAAKTADMWAVDLGGNIDNFFLGGEYAEFTLDRQCGNLAVAGCNKVTDVIDHPQFSGWYVEGSWIMTGETKAYSPTAINNEVGGFNAPIPSRPFSLEGGSWGAWELTARYSDTDLNWNGNRVQNAAAGILAGVPGGRETVVALGVNWYLNRNIRMVLDDNIVTVHKGVIGNLHRDDQDINVVALRLQYAN